MSEKRPEHVDDPTDEDEVDEASKQSFPTSDPPATWAGSDEKAD